MPVRGVTLRKMRSQSAPTRANQILYNCKKKSVVAASDKVSKPAAGNHQQALPKGLLDIRSPADLRGSCIRVSVIYRTGAVFNRLDSSASIYFTNPIWGGDSTQSFI